MFKALFIGYLFGVRSERQLVREIEVNVAYRWFLRLKLTDTVFDASTLSQNRRRRYQDETIAQGIFDRIVEQAIRAGLVDGTVLYTDSTHLKANANKAKFDLVVATKSRADYWDDLDAAIEEDRAAHGKKPLREKERQPVEKETKVSRTDPDSGYMVRDGKPKGFFYLDHRTVDGRHAIITDTFTTPANVHDSIVYLGRLDRQMERFGLPVAAVGLDAGYATPGIARGLEERAIRGVTGYRNPTPPRTGMMRKSAFTYEPGRDGYRCPEGQLLAYATTDRTGYRHYKSDPTVCRDCPLIASCTASANATRLITRHVWQDARERNDANRLTAWGKAVYRRRKETVERSFADAKQLHGHRYARFRSLTRVRVQCLLAAAAQNIKKKVIASGATALFMLELADAIELHVAAQRRGLSIPGDLSLIVLGSHIRPAATGVQFTTFAVPREEMARRATQMLAERIETGGPGEQVLLACDPVPGETLGPAPDHQKPERTP